MQTAAYTCVSKCPYFNPWGNPVLYPRRRDTQGPQGLCTRTIQTRRLAPTVGEASQTRKFQVSLLFVDHRIVSLDMPPLCKWPEVGGVPIVSGDGQCSDIVSEVFKHLRGYLRPLTLAGIYPKRVLVGNSSRDRLRHSRFPRGLCMLMQACWHPASNPKYLHRYEPPHRIKSQE